MTGDTEGAEVRRFSRRIVVLETPSMVEQLQDFAQQAGHSVGAEVRSAIRYWIRAHERGGDDDHE